MKFIFDRNSMINEISIAQEIISTKSNLSILSNVLFIAQNNTLTIKATDIKVNFETKIPVEIEEEGSTTIYCDKFMTILSNLDEGEVKFEIQQKDNQTVAVIKHLIKSEKYQLKCMSQDKFPEFPEAMTVPFFEVPAKELKEMINQTSFAVSEDETRYFMNGVYFERKDDRLVLVATDGKRLAYSSKNIGITSDFPSAIVHPKVLNIVAKHSSDEGNVSVAIVDKMIFFKFSNYEMSSALLDGQFPNYSRVIPENQSYSFQVEKSDLLRALKGTSSMVDKKAGRIFFTINPGTLTVISQESDFGDAELKMPCQYAGEEVTFALNYRYVEEPLKVIGSDRIAFEFTEPMKALTLRSEPAGDSFHIIMPMQMN